MHLNLLTIDIGNTLTKVCIFKGDTQVFSSRYTDFSSDEYVRLTQQYEWTEAWISAVATIPLFLQALVASNPRVHLLDASTCVPIEMKPEQRLIVGSDRLAAAIAADSLFPAEPILVVVAGTCITYEYLNHHAYLGGSISPGLRLRLKALNDYTHLLPFVEPHEYSDFIGRDTESAILTGTLGGLIHEINGMIQSYRTLHPKLRVIFSGGDSELLHPHISLPHQRIENIVTLGLRALANGS